MQVTGSGAVARPEVAVDPRVSAAETVAPAASAPNPVDQIAITEIARINLLMPPRDGANLAQLQEAVFSGRYGPPAVTIAEALIAVAVARGLKV